MSKRNQSSTATFNIETIIELARCSRVDRIILAGSRAPHRMFELHQRGFARVATTGNCGLPYGQYDAAFVEWHMPSIKALVATLEWLVHFLGSEAVLVIALDTQVCRDYEKLRSTLAKLGFRVEAGTRSDHGIVMSARRRQMGRQAVAA